MEKEAKTKTAREIAIDIIRESMQRLGSMPDDEYIKFAPVVFDMCYKIGDF